MKDEKTGDGPLSFSYLQITKKRETEDRPLSLFSLTVTEIKQSVIIFALFFIDFTVPF